MIGNNGKLYYGTNPGNGFENLAVFFSAAHRLISQVATASTSPAASRSVPFSWVPAKIPY